MQVRGFSGTPGSGVNRRCRCGWNRPQDSARAAACPAMAGCRAERRFTQPTSGRGAGRRRRRARRESPSRPPGRRERPSARPRGRRPRGFPVRDRRSRGGRSRRRHSSPAMISATIVSRTSIRSSYVARRFGLDTMRRIAPSPSWAASPVPGRSPRGMRRVEEERRPLLEGAVGGDDQGAALVALADVLVGPVRQPSRSSPWGDGRLVGREVTACAPCRGGDPRIRVDLRF